MSVALYVDNQQEYGYNQSIVLSNGTKINKHHDDVILLKELPDKRSYRKLITVIDFEENQKYFLIVLFCHQNSHSTIYPMDISVD